MRQPVPSIFLSPSSASKPGPSPIWQVVYPLTVVPLSVGPLLRALPVAPADAPTALVPNAPLRLELTFQYVVLLVLFDHFEPRLYSSLTCVSWVGHSWLESFVRIHSRDDGKTSTRHILVRSTSTRVDCMLVRLHVEYH